MNVLMRLATVVMVPLLVMALLGFIGLGLFNAGKITEREQVTSKYDKPTPVPQDAVTPYRSNAIEQPRQIVSNTPKPIISTNNLTESTFVPSRKTGSGYARIQSSEDETKQVVVKPSATNASSQYKKHQQVYASLQKTCNNWTRWYNRDRTQSAAFQMNVSCKDAANYAAKHLRVQVTPNHVALNSPAISSSSGGRAFLIGDGEEPESSSHCESLKRQKEIVQAQLRAGYSGSQGDRLRARRRYLNEEIRNHCR